MQKNLRLSNSFLLSLFVISFVNSFAQTDTITTVDNEKISCSITEISHETVRFITTKSVNVLDISSLQKITFKNGTSECFVPKKTKFDASNEETKAFIQKKASEWGAKILNCSFPSVSLNATYVYWDQTYAVFGNDSLIHIGLKTMFAIPFFEDREEFVWYVTTNSQLENPKFYFTKSSNFEKQLLNCVARTNRAVKKLQP